MDGEVRRVVPLAELDPSVPGESLASFSVHTTRHTCATLLVALDVHPRIMMRILRHSQIAETMNIYAQLASEATRPPGSASRSSSPSRPHP
ncbi:tyrosine-type recombinase/integrase [Micromonospora chalcea]|uniref:tyrosine-type recombinase/integrase n=1 Tax=Micromonospora chalcea TaxID=1874 RepID=UPI00157CC4CC|nr:tyrosine-type recombinase/integrase [Micromonospora chalcea]